MKKLILVMMLLSWVLVTSSGSGKQEIEVDKDDINTSLIKASVTFDSLNRKLDEKGI